MSTYKVLPTVERTIDKLISEFDQISEERKYLIAHLQIHVGLKKDEGKKILLNFICTHNSRRSHISQIWAQTAAHYYGIANVEAYSGGTEATAFNPRAVTAMKDAGFDISTIKNGQNPVYKVKYSNDAPALTIFSKKFDDDLNPKTDFAAVMTCLHADDTCPFIPGAKRISLTYNDPKEFDGTPLEAAKYSERVHEIGREILFAFSQVK
jgi:arsenate reductase